MEYAVLVDVTKCIDCRGCQVSCKRWNDLEGEATTLSTSWTNPPTLTYKTYTHIQFHLDYDQSSGDTDWRFLNWRCMHCHTPACKEACPVNAIKDEREKFEKMTCLAHAIKHVIYPLALKSEEGRKRIERVTNTAGYDYWIDCFSCVKVCPLNKTKD